MTEQGIQVVNTPCANTRSVAEHTVMLILATAKFAAGADRMCREGRFSERYTLPATEISGKTLGLIGFGRIAQMVANMAISGFGMQVQGYHYNRNLDHSTAAVLTDQLEEVLTKSDFVSMHLPMRSETRHFMGSARLAMMKKTACFINTARGGVVDEQALLCALQQKNIAGAGLDVFEQEPPSATHPLFLLDNVVLSPHSAALTGEARIRMALQAAQGIDEVLSGRPPSWPVNPPARQKSAHDDADIPHCPRERKS